MIQTRVLGERDKIDRYMAVRSGGLHHAVDGRSIVTRAGPQTKENDTRGHAPV